MMHISWGCRGLALIALILLSSCSAAATPSLTSQPTATPNFQLSTTSPDGKLQATIWVTEAACGDFEASIQIVDSSSGQQTMSLKSECHGYIRVSQASFSPDGKWFAAVGTRDTGSKTSGGPYGYIGFWSVSTGELIVEYGCVNGAKSLTFSSDSARIEGTCESAYSFVLDTATFKARIDGPLGDSDLFPLGGSLAHQTPQP
jgi:hypothetical protein